jgi:protocatechuate 3,4-dioxygenase alpha subunit
VPDGIVELYQADASGRYPDVASPVPSFTGFGRLPTGADGCCLFKTVKPGVVRMNGAEEAPHINVCLLSRGLLRQIYTRIYFKGDRALAADPILTLVPAERRSTLLAAPSLGDPSLWEFVIRMQGDDETVFFDL